VAITNVVRCRPPRDWLEGAPYASNAIYNCSVRYLAEVIHGLRPACILALGGTAFRTLASIPKGKYGSLDYQRGYVVPGAGVAEGRLVIGTYHPAFMRRGNPHLTPLLQRDLRRAWLVAQGKLVEGLHFATNPGTLGLKYQTEPSLAEAWEFVKSIDPALPLAYDIETPQSTRGDEDERTSFTDRDIKLIQFTQQRGAGIALPFRDEFVDVAVSALAGARVKVGFNNWCFDDPVLAANGIDCGETHDAMILYHFYWSDLPKNLQSAAQMCGFQFPWKHLGETDLELYGCVDVDSTLCVFEHMKKVLEGEAIG
jgi:hypothetical protein